MLTSAPLTGLSTKRWRLDTTYKESVGGKGAQEVGVEALDDLDLDGLEGGRVEVLRQERDGLSSRVK